MFTSSGAQGWGPVPYADTQWAEVGGWWPLPQGAQFSLPHFSHRNNERLRGAWAMAASWPNTASHLYFLWPTQRFWKKCKQLLTCAFVRFHIKEVLILACPGKSAVAGTALAKKWRPYQWDPSSLSTSHPGSCCLPVPVFREAGRVQPHSGAMAVSSSSGKAAISGGAQSAVLPEGSALTPPLFSKILTPCSFSFSLFLFLFF